MQWLDHDNHVFVARIVPGIYLLLEIFPGQGVDKASICILIYPDDSSTDFEVAVSVVWIDNCQRYVWLTLDIPILLRRLEQAEFDMAAIPCKPDWRVLGFSPWPYGRYRGNGRRGKNIHVTCWNR